MSETDNAPQASQQPDSLVRRLAGASVNKAGLALDQTEINRIIAEVSKGSKFYENEKRKDKELTVKVNKIREERDEVLRGVDIARIEADVDQLIMKLEEGRDLSQYIVHVDMDAFFANVETLRDPTLKGKPFIVGGGVVSTASYEARKFGVRSGMAGFIARRLCPTLITVNGHYHLYGEYSNKIMAIFRRYDPTMCPAGIDEAYLNITQYCNEHGQTMEDVVSEMRQAVFDETQLTVSAGMAPNKMLAKICSDMNKPNGQYKLDFDAVAIRSFMRDLSIRKIPGIGRVSERLLESIDIKKCGDIYTHRGLISLMDKRFGLVFLVQTYLGIASNHVEPHAREERKSIGSERTFSTLDSNHSDPEKGSHAILKKLEEIAEELEEDMQKEGWVGKTVTLKYKLDDFQTFTRAKSFGRWVTTKEVLFNTGKELLLPEFPLKLRLIGLRLTKLKDLRADDEPVGIKRFFEPVKQNDGGSPRKRRRLELAGTNEDASVEEDADHDKEDTLIYNDDVDEFEGEGFLLLEDQHSDSPGLSKKKKFDPNRPRPPVSAPACSPPAEASTSKHPSTSTTRSASIGPINMYDPNAKEPESAMLECPICNRKLQTDNQGLNAHIDFCLSRGAIWDAQGEAIASSSSSSSAAKDRKERERDPSPTPHGSRSTTSSKKGRTTKPAKPARPKGQGVLQWVKRS